MKSCTIVQCGKNQTVGEAIVRCSECYFKRKIQAVGQVFTSQDSSDAVSLSQVPAFVRGGGPSAFVKSRHRKELDEDASHALHTKAGGEKIFRRRTGNDETNFAGSVWVQIGWRPTHKKREGGAEILQIWARAYGALKISIWSYFHASASVKGSTDVKTGLTTWSYSHQWSL